MEIIIAIIIGGIFWAVIAGILAKRKGKDVLPWILLGFLLGWIAIIILACTRDERRRSRTPSALRSASDAICANQKPICMKCGNTLTKGPVCDMCGHTNTTSSFEKSSMSSHHSPKEVPKVPKYKCKGCEETIDTLQCPWCGRKHDE